jgi:thimet oligopeptidase
VCALTDRDTELSLEFSRNIRDGRREIRVAPAALAGLPQDFIDAHPVDHDGLIVLTTEYTDLMPVREYATDRATRTALVAAYNDLAWPVNDVSSPSCWPSARNVRSCSATATGPTTRPRPA